MDAIPQFNVTTAQAMTLTSPYGICYATSSTYPMNAAYRKGTSTNGMYGIAVRIWSIIFATMVNSRCNDYYPLTRTVVVGNEIRNLLKRFKAGSGGSTRSMYVDALHMYETTTFHDRNGEPVQPFDNGTLVDDKLFQSRLILSERYVELLRDHPREVPANYITAISGALQLDLLMLAVLYCPFDRMLIIRREDFRKIIPASSPSSLLRGQLQKHITVLNQIQTEWVYRLKDHDLVIRPSTVLIKEQQAVVLQPVK